MLGQSPPYFLQTKKNSPCSRRRSLYFDNEISIVRWRVYPKPLWTPPPGVCLSGTSYMVYAFLIGHKLHILMKSSSISGGCVRFTTGRGSSMCWCPQESCTEAVCSATEEQKSIQNGHCCQTKPQLFSFNWQFCTFLHSYLSSFVPTSFLPSPSLPSTFTYWY